MLSFLRRIARRIDVNIPSWDAFACDTYIGHSTQPGIRSYFLFGLGYGTASLSCTLPVFLTVVGSSIAVSGILTSAAQFVLYAFGMGGLILALTLSAAFFKTALVGALRRVLPYMQPASALLMLAAGAYVTLCGDSVAYTQLWPSERISRPCASTTRRTLLGHRGTPKPARRS